MEAYRLYYPTKYRVGGYKLPYMVCHVLLEGQAWSADHPDQLPLLPILVLDIVESTLNLWQAIECMKYLQIIVQIILQNGLELDRKMNFW